MSPDDEQTIERAQRAISQLFARVGFSVAGPLSYDIAPLFVLLQRIRDKEAERVPCCSSDTTRCEVPTPTTDNGETDPLTKAWLRLPVTGKVACSACESTLATRRWQPSPLDDRPTIIRTCTTCGYPEGERPRNWASYKPTTTK